MSFEAYPETKKNIIQNLQNQGNLVIFIGDGINDSPVLA
jgi:Cu+-exporting ATPase